ncbi:DUF1653 domain-containing protein [Paenibacillus xylanexedens]|uniref:DUF1653 domain-containing protein n=1 Tax=Paenibacillus xylanexedens TaxID=528191 RepID=A0ABS4RW90_PAEXY|nr:DUF1653 domain-containing protein [Paenibacillus xylanexedens]MBP2247165.1 hypothetical protein [Paenibacillus xylanexedens]
MMYRHFKGGIYEFLQTAEHSETHEILVIYRNEDGKIYARPYEMFFGSVYVNGIEVPRFKKIEASVCE